MPLFRVRLEAQDGSGHFRQTTLEAPSKGDAKRACERMEIKRVLYEMPSQMQAEVCERYGVASIEDLPKPGPLGSSQEERAPFRELGGNDRARLHAHYQDLPYEVTKVEQVS